MNNLVKVIIRTGCKNNKELFLRLHRNADHVRNVNHLSKKTPDKMIRICKDKFNRIINIRSYAWQLNNGNIQCLEQNSLSNENKISRGGLENDFARTIFENSIHYAKTVLLPNRFKVMVTNEEALQILNTDWSTAKPCELISAFRKLSHNIMSNDTDQIDKTKYSNIFTTLNKRIPDLDDDMLEELLKCLIPFNKCVNNLQPTFTLLDKECARRYTRWSIDKMLLISDIFYWLNIHKKSDYIWKLMRKMNSKLNKLTPNNLVQLLFLVNVTRKSELNMYEVEVRLEEHLDDLSIDELGIVAMGYFKSKTKIKNSLLLRAMINRLICELDKADTISVAALTKLIRYSMHYNEVVHFRLLLNKIISIVPRLDLMCLVHIAHASAKAIVYEKPLMDAIIGRVYNDMQDARIKDIERLAFMLSTFNIDTRHPIYDKIINEATERMSHDNMKEFKRFPRALPNLLLYLSHQDIYPLHLLEVAMDPSYLKLIHKGSPRHLTYNYSVLQHSVMIDRPEYTGPLLTEGHLRTLTKLHSKVVQDKLSNVINKIFNEIVYVLKENIAGDIDLYIGKLLPHFVQNDIVIGIDENRNFLSLEPVLSKFCDVDIKRVNDTFPKNVKSIVFVIIHYSHRIKGTNEPIGIIKAKVRQLERIGYTPILITDVNWLRCRTLPEQINYLQDLLKNV